MGRIIGLFLRDLCNIFEGDCALNVFAGEDCLLFPFHEHLEVRWHGDHGSLVYRMGVQGKGVAGLSECVGGFVGKHFCTRRLAYRKRSETRPIMIER